MRYLFLITALQCVANAALGSPFSDLPPFRYNDVPGRQLRVSLSQLDVEVADNCFASFELFRLVAKSLYLSGACSEQIRKESNFALFVKTAVEVSSVNSANHRRVSPALVLGFGTQITGSADGPWQARVGFSLKIKKPYDLVALGSGFNREILQEWFDLTDNETFIIFTWPFEYKELLFEYHDTRLVNSLSSNWAHPLYSSDLVMISGKLNYFLSNRLKAGFGIEHYSVISKDFTLNLFLPSLSLAYDTWL